MVGIVKTAQIDEQRSNDQKRIAPHPHLAARSLLVRIQTVRVYVPSLSVVSASIRHCTKKTLRASQSPRGEMCCVRERRERRAVGVSQPSMCSHVHRSLPQSSVAARSTYTWRALMERCVAGVPPRRRTSGSRAEGERQDTPRQRMKFAREWPLTCAGPRETASGDVQERYPEMWVQDKKATSARCSLKSTTDVC